MKQSLIDRLNNIERFEYGGGPKYIYIGLRGLSKSEHNCFIVKGFLLISHKCIQCFIKFCLYESTCVSDTIGYFGTLMTDPFSGSPHSSTLMLHSSQIRKKGSIPKWIIHFQPQTQCNLPNTFYDGELTFKICRFSLIKSLEFGFNSPTIKIKYISLLRRLYNHTGYSS